MCTLRVTIEMPQHEIMIEQSHPQQSPLHAEAKLEYQRRLQQRELSAVRLQGRHFWLGNARIVVFVGIIVLCWIIGKTGYPSLFWLGALVLLFIGLVVSHRRVVRAMALARRAVAVYARGIARMEDRWAGSGEPG